MYTCKSCGAPLSGNETFCRQCGARVVPPEGQTAPMPETQAAPEPERPVVPQAPVYSQPGRQNAPVYSAPDKRPDRVLGAWSYVLSIFLMSLPFAGLVLQIVWACGATSSLNRRNLARGYLLLTAIIVVLYILLFVVILAGVAPHLEDLFDEFYPDYHYSQYRF